MEETKHEPDFSKLKKDKQGKYIVTEDLDPTLIMFALANSELRLLPERYETRKKAEKALADMDEAVRNEYTIAETR